MSLLTKKIKLIFTISVFDQNFDRIKIEKIKKFYNLTARLDHSIKGTSISRLRNYYLDKFTDKKFNIKIVKI